MSDELSQALELVRTAVDSVPDKILAWEEYLDSISMPLRVAELVKDKSQAAVGRWLVWGYEKFASGHSVVAFCKEVRGGLIETGMEEVPSVETFRAWYYAASHPESILIAEEDGFGMASACLLSNDPDGERASGLRAAAKQVASETGMGQVSAARALRAAYSGHEEKEWADGLPRFVYVPVLSDNTLQIMAQWRDESLTYLGFINQVYDLTSQLRGEIAVKHLKNCLHLREWKGEGK